MSTTHAPAESPMEDASQHPRSGKPRRFYFAAALACFVSIVLLRNMAPELDFAVVHIVTWALGLLGWIFSCLALRTFPQSRGMARLVFWGPIVGAALFASLYRFERFDGELRPVFALRWSTEAELPTASPTASADADDPTFAATPHDFPQFLGPHRNAILPEINLVPDWQEHPPEIRWKQPIGDGWSAYATRGEVAVTMEQRDAEEWITAYRISDGQIVWHYAIPARHFNAMGGAGPRSTPTIADGRVYACSAVSRFVCLDLKTGQPLWERSLLELGGCTQQDFEQFVAWGRAGSPLVVDGLVVCPLGGTPPDLRTLVAFDAETGEQVWTAGDDQISYSSPILAQIDGVRQILYVSESHLAAYAPQDGTLLWSSPWPSKSNASASCSQPVVVDGQRILLSKAYGQGAKLVEVRRTGDQWTAESVWENPRVLKTKFTSCVAADGYAYGLSDGILECVDLENGQRKWKRGRYRQGQLLMVGRHLLVSAESGEIALVDASPEGFHELGRMPVIEGVTWNTLTLAGDQLLMRNSDQAACVDLPLEGEQPAGAAPPGGDRSAADRAGGRESTADLLGRKAGRSILVSQENTDRETVPAAARYAGEH